MKFILQSVDLCHLSTGVAHLLPIGLLVLLYASDPLQKKKKASRITFVTICLLLNGLGDFAYLWNCEVTCQY